MPVQLLPEKGRYRLRDYEKVFCADRRNDNDIFTMRGIDRGQGCVVVVRPDQYVANILPMSSHDQLATFFDTILK
jgi:phenol 2-monooxygenase